ncbi:MAG: glycosyltransferase family 2 protein [Hydrogenothermaceae bacterium]|nr:glycosyltransferase family 2 protein [Hydrogenothermaceae bacterium]
MTIRILFRVKENREIVEQFSKNYPFVVYHKNKKNLGATGNYRNLFELSTGDLIQFLGDDDIFSPVALEKLSKPLSENKDIYVTAGKTFFVDMDRSINLVYVDRARVEANYLFKNKAVKGKDVIKYSYTNSIINMFGSFSGFMFRRKDVDFPLFRFGNYDFKANADIFLWKRLARKGYIFLYEDFLNLFRLHGGNDKLKEDVQLKGLEEMLVFYREDLMEYYEVPQEDIFLSSSKIISNILTKFVKKNFRSREVKRLLKRNDTFNLGERNSFSIIIVAYKNEHTIKNCIGSFIETLTGQDEVIILDNSPNNKTEEALTDYLEKYKNIKFIKNEDNLGYAKAINKGVRLSENSYLVFLNPEVVSKDWLVKFSQHLSKDKKVVAVGPVSNAAFFYNNIINYLNIQLLRETEIEETVSLLQNLYKDRGIEVRILSGFCIATKKNYFLRYGMFDEILILGI